MQEEQPAPSADSVVASFEAGIITLKRAWIGVCIKFAMQDRSARITHWSPHAFKALVDALQAYFEQLGMNAFMIRANDDPTLVASLPARHPYHTLLSDRPKLSDDEIGTAGLKTGIGEAEFEAHGNTFELRPLYGDGHRASIWLHEYTALSLLGYLREYLKVADTLSGPAAGNA
ncbi:hypothetical protein [Piscinibacter sp.]|uniref:hypothetical protein n=1 Tax=Piscinibacter sp. TaxID=1903157 RepID=UPI0035AF01F2